jgi:hypothetical protein
MQDYCQSPDLLLGGCPYSNISSPYQDPVNILDYDAFTVMYPLAAEAYVPVYGSAIGSGNSLLSHFYSTGACNVMKTANPDVGGPGVSVP